MTASDPEDREQWYATQMMDSFAGDRIRDLAVGDEVRWDGRSAWLTIITAGNGRAEAVGPNGGRYLLADMPNHPGPDYHIGSNKFNSFQRRVPTDRQAATQRARDLSESLDEKSDIEGVRFAELPDEAQRSEYVALRPWSGKYTQTSMGVIRTWLSGGSVDRVGNI